MINEAARAYKGVILTDRWLDPHTPRAELRRDVEHGVVLWYCDEDGDLVAVLRIQAVEGLALTNDAHVRPVGNERASLGGCCPTCAFGKVFWF
jgi:hypothetical protein